MDRRAGLAEAQAGAPLAFERFKSLGEGFELAEVATRHGPAQLRTAVFFQVFSG